MNVGNYFSSRARNYESNSHRGVFKFIRRLETLAVKTLLSNITFNNFLELGCGAGHFTKVLTSLSPNGTVNDISSSMLDQTCSSKIVKVPGDMLEIDIFDRFDLVVALGSLEFLPNGKKIFERMSGWTNQSGHLLLMVPQKIPFGILYKFYYSLQGLDIHLFNEGDLYTTLLANNFEVEKSIWVFPFNRLVLAKKVQ